MKITKVVATVVDDNDKEHEVTIESCHGSYIQYGAYREILSHTVHLAEAVRHFLYDEYKDGGGSNFDEEE